MVKWNTTTAVWDWRSDHEEIAASINEALQSFGVGCHFSLMDTKLLFCDKDRRERSGFDTVDVAIALEKFGITAFQHKTNEDSHSFVFQKECNG